MDKNSAETVVKVISVLYWIGAVLSIVIGIVMLLGGGSFFLMNNFDGGNIFGGFLAVIGIIAITYGILSFIVGLGLWRHRNWARIIAIIVSILGLLSFSI